MLSTVFFGTHQFAETVLKGLIADPYIDVQLVVTQPDKPVGRKKVMTPPKTKILAAEHNIRVHQPPSLKKDKTDYSQFDLAIVAQYGKIIPERIIGAPKHGTLNTHTSLLPKYRGASPIQTALWKGETTTGVTIMQMDAGMDTGPILLQKTIEILPDETYPELDARLAPLALEALKEAVPAYVSGSLTPQPQQHEEATTCSLLSRADGRIDWQQSKQDIYNQYRGLTPWPGVWTMLGKKRLKIQRMKPADISLAPGMLQAKNDVLFIGCKDGAIAVQEVQLEGKPAMDAASFLRGAQLPPSLNE